MKARDSVSMSSAEMTSTALWDKVFCATWTQMDMFLFSLLLECNFKKIGFSWD